MKVQHQVLKILTICLIFTQRILAGNAQVCLDHSNWVVQHRNNMKEWKDITTVDAARRWLSCFEPYVCDPYPGNDCDGYNSRNAQLCLDHSNWVVQNRNTRIEWKDITTVNEAKRWLSCFETHVCDPYPGNNCDEYKLNPNPKPDPKPDPIPNPNKNPIGWRSQGTVGQGWCVGEKPTDDWTLIGTCPDLKRSQVRILSYNLYWWNLFGQRGGNGKSAGNLISKAYSESSFDFMGFQECDDINWIMSDSQLQSQYGTFQGHMSVAIAWRKDVWQAIFTEFKDVSEDRKDEWWGKREAVYGRFLNKKTGQTAFFMNLHGPLPVDTGGLCGGEALAYNLLKIIGTKANKEDLLILVGDFNQKESSETIKSLKKKFNLLYTGNSFGGVDNVFSNCPAVQTKNLGNGGSDHDALSVTISL